MYSYVVLVVFSPRIIVYCVAKISEMMIPGGPEMSRYHFSACPVLREIWKKTTFSEQKFSSIWLVIYSHEVQNLKDWCLQPFLKYNFFCLVSRKNQGSCCYSLMVGQRAEVQTIILLCQSGTKRKQSIETNLMPYL